MLVNIAPSASWVGVSTALGNNWRTWLSVVPSGMPPMLLSSISHNGWVGFGALATLAATGLPSLHAAKNKQVNNKNGILVIVKMVLRISLYILLANFHHFSKHYLCVCVKTLLPQQKRTAHSTKQKINNLCCKIPFQAAWKGVFSAWCCFYWPCSSIRPSSTLATPNVAPTTPKSPKFW